MRIEDIKDEKLLSLIKAANNAGGDLEVSLWESLHDSKDERVIFLNK